MGNSPYSRRLSITAALPAVGSGNVILAPWIAHLPPEGLEILPLLPVADLNAITLGALPGMGGGGAGCAVALMLADPFLRVRDALPILRRARLGSVANFPTVQIVDGDAARALEAAGLGARREAAALACFRSEGLAAIAFARDLAGARIMLEADPAILVLHPGVPLADWRARAAASVVIAKVAQTLRAETRLPILVYRPKGYGPELERAAALVDGTASIDVSAET